MQSPLLQREGVQPKQPILTSKQYSKARISRVGKSEHRIKEGEVSYEIIEGSVSTVIAYTFESLHTTIYEHSVRTPWYG